MDLQNEPTVPAPAGSDSQFLWLRKQLLAILVLIIVICGAMDIVTWHQIRYMRADLKSYRAVVEDYQQKSGAPVENFLKRVFDYAQTHEDFRPVLMKYGIVPTTNAAPAAMPPATPKK